MNKGPTEIEIEINTLGGETYKVNSLSSQNTTIGELKTKIQSQSGKLNFNLFDLNQSL